MSGLCNKTLYNKLTGLFYSCVNCFDWDSRILLDKVVYAYNCMWLSRVACTRKTLYFSTFFRKNVKSLTYLQKVMFFLTYSWFVC